jgi:hypothetical protein
MAKAYQYTADGYFADEIEDYGLLPNNATHTAPPAEQSGHVLHWTGAAWEQIENHKGEEGYLNGEPYTIKDYGPYPEGWSTTPPPPTPDELEARFSGMVTGHLNDFARQRQYDDITSARLAALSGEFAADGQAAQAAYDQTWTAAIALAPKVRSGELTPEQAIEQLPALAW